MPKILVIEDEAALREGILGTLEVEGYELLEAGDGHTGIELARQHRPDLIVCDIMMPALDGFNVLLAIRSTPQTAMIPFVFLTSRADRASVRKGMEFGADDYLTKPFTSDELLGAVRTQLHRQAQIQEKYARQASNLQDVIMSVLPHEFRTPLTGVLVAAQWLLMDYDNLEAENAQSLLQTIVKSGKRLQRLIENYLMYAQLETVRLVPERMEALAKARMEEPKLIIQTTAFKQADKMGRADDLVLDVEGEEQTVQIAQAHMEKIVEELVDNACKFSALGTPVEVKTAYEAEGLALYITDQGRGMTPEQIANINAYTQFERKLYEQQGAGLGLILAKRLAELHGGTLTIQSTPGEYTAVRVVLPAKTDTLL